MERNLRLYPVYQALRSAYFWLPVFFLYFLSLLSVEEALLLEAVYYLAVVVVEVPSGWFSDRFGRRPTLVAAMACTASAAALFAGGATFAVFACAQVLQAAGHAMNSGTDSALLYDSLRDLGRESEVGPREGRALSAGLAASAGAAALGGLLAGFELRLAYGLTGAAALGALAVAWRFREPAHAAREAFAESAARTLAGRLRDPALRWLFVFVVGMVVLSHVPYEFFQPYLELLLAEPDRQVPGYALAPAASGALVAGSMLLGSLASRGAIRVRARLGWTRALLLTQGLVLVIIAGMASALAAWVVPLILLRSAPMGLVNPIALAEIHPRVPTRIRATYLSVQSLAGRLAFSACLALASWSLAGSEMTHPIMARVLWSFAAGGLLLLGALALAARRVRPTRDSS